MFTPADFTPDYPEDSDNEHFEHDPPFSQVSVSAMFPITTFDDVIPTPPHFEKAVTLVVESLIEIKLGTVTGPCPTFLGSGLTEVQYPKPLTNIVPV